MGRFKRLTQSSFFSKMMDDEIFDLAAALSYYSALSLAPLMILLLTLLALIGDDFKSEFWRQIQGVIGQDATETAKTLAIHAGKAGHLRNFAGAFGIVTLLFSAGAMFGQLRSSLNKIFEIENKEQDTWGFVKTKLFNTLMVLTFILISTLSLLVSSFLSLAFVANQGVFVEVLNFFVSALIFVFIFSCLYYFLPDTKIRLRVVLTSGCITALLFSIGKSLIGFYLGRIAVASIYGAAGSFIVLLMWVYYSSVVIFISAEIAHELNREEHKLL
jgi:membrane protein